LLSSSPAGNQWFINGIPLADSTGPELVATQSGNYAVSVSDAAGCSDTSTVQEVVILSADTGSRVAPAILPAGAVFTCTSALLTAGSSGSFQWFLNGVRLPGQSGNTLLATQPGSYTVTADSTACGLPGGPSAPVIVTVIKSTAPAIIDVNGLLFSNYSDDNQWYLNDSPIPGATEQVYTPATPGSYTVRIEVRARAGDPQLPSTAGCDGPFSAPYVLKDTSLPSSPVQVYPNPVVNELTLQNLSASPSTVRIFDMFGRQLLMIPGLLGTQVLDVRRWGKGIYLIQMTDQGTRKVTHVEVLKL
jgi:hypothetical protein